MTVRAFRSGVPRLLGPSSANVGGSGSGGRSQCGDRTRERNEVSGKHIAEERHDDPQHDRAADTHQAELQKKTRPRRRLSDSVAKSRPPRREREKQGGAPDQERSDAEAVNAKASREL